MNSSTVLFVLATVLTVHIIAAQGVGVYQINGQIYCGSLTCPTNAVGCAVISKNNPNNPKKIITTETCTDASGNVVAEKQHETDNPSGAIVNSESGVGPEYEARAQEQAEEIRKTIENNIKQTFQSNPFFNGNGFGFGPNFGSGFPFNRF